MKSKYKVGDRVLIKDYLPHGGAMIESMLEEHGGQIRTISKVMNNNYDDEDYFTYEVVEDSCPYKFEFNDEDIERLVESAPPQRIELPIPGGMLVAETSGGEDYPGIFISFYASGGTLEHPLCFAEVCATENPDTIRVGTYYADCDEVKDIEEFLVWPKEEDDV